MGARAGGGAGMGGGVLGRMKAEYFANIDSDIAAYDSPGGAVGKLIGDTQTKELDALKSAIGEMKGVKSVTDMRKVDENIGKAFSTFHKNMNEKISLLEHNSQLAKGKAKQTFAKAISTLEMTKYNVGDKHSKYSFGKAAQKMEEYFISKNKWK